MAFESQSTLDSIDRRILAELQTNARISFAELGRRVRLSTPAVIERVKRLEEDGTIEGYHARVNPARVGLSVLAMVQVNIAGDRLEKFAAVSRKIPEVLECHRVTGSESYILQVAATDVGHLQKIIDKLMPYVSTNTSIILASPVSWAPITPPQAPPDAR